MNQIKKNPNMNQAVYNDKIDLDCDINLSYSGGNAL